METVVAALVTLAVPAAAVGVMWQLVGKWCPPAVWLMRRGGQRVRRTIWEGPVRQFGCLFTLLLWLVVIAVITTLVAAGSGGVAWLMAVISWLSVWGVWRGIRYWHRLRYTPRPLPERERED